MSVLEHGKRIAELLLQSQDIAEKLKEAMALPLPPPTPPVEYVFKELPKGLSYYYNPHQSKTVPAGERVTVWSFKVPPNHIFHVEQLGTNWYEDTYLLWIADGNQLEKIERFYGEINAPIDIRRRYIFSKQEMRFIAVNNSSEDVIYDVYADGTVYLNEDFFEAAKRGLLA